MKLKVISGGQTGCDTAALRAAKTAGLETGGWAPEGFLTEDGPAPWLAEFGLTELPTASYPARTKQNIEGSDGTLVLFSSLLGFPKTPGTRLTIQAVTAAGKPLYAVNLAGAGALPARVEEVCAWVRRERVRVLNVAGPRESKSPGIGGRAEAFLASVFALLKGGSQP